MRRGLGNVRFRSGSGSDAPTCLRPVPLRGFTGASPSQTETLAYKRAQRYRNHRVQVDPTDEGIPPDPGTHPTVRRGPVATHSALESVLLGWLIYHYPLVGSYPFPPTLRVTP